MASRLHSAARVLCAVVVAIPLLIGPLRAQEAFRLERGTQIRFSPQVLHQRHVSSDVQRDVHMAYVQARRVTATVVRSDADTVLVRLSKGGARLSLPWESFEWIEKRDSRVRSTVTGTLAGATVVGASLAALGAYVWTDEICEFMGRCWDNPNRSPAEQATDFGLKGVVVGGAIGFAIGAMGVFDRWRSVPVPARVAVTPGRDHLGLSASVRF